MGTPKAALLFDGVPLLQHLVRRLAALFPEIVLVRAPGQELPLSEEFRRSFPGIVAVEDAVTDQGPVAGLCAGLEAVTRPLAFAASCDVPFLNVELAARLVELADGFDVVAPEWEGRLQPLQAVYRPSVHLVLAEQLASGRRRLLDLYERVAVRKVTGREILGLDPDGLTFLNVNTPDEYERALALWAVRRS
jgi:molybdopterin-guanine dinucleotide biosynthesis protein A